jgi:hypothetical protein
VIFCRRHIGIPRARAGEWLHSVRRRMSCWLLARLHVQLEDATARALAVTGISGVGE